MGHPSVAALGLSLVFLAALPPSVGASKSPEGRRSELWVARYNGPGDDSDHANSLTVSADGSKVFATGYSHGVGSAEDYATVAYDAATGHPLWIQRCNGPGNGTDVANSVAVSPDGSKVFVTGYSFGAGSGDDYATAAYDGATGAPLWLRRYNGPGNGTDQASSVTVSPDGSKVFVTGYTTGTRTVDYATLAYDSATGAPLWLRRYNGPGNGDDQAQSLAVSSDGSKVVVTGYGDGGPTGDDFATIAYNAVTGSPLWVSRYNGPVNAADQAYSVGVRALLHWA